MNYPPQGIMFNGGDIAFNVRTKAYFRADTIKWIDCFDIGASAGAYETVWDVASLNTQGLGTNVASTTPSFATLLTAGAVGDNEGTRSAYKIITRAKKNRTEISVTLKQTANTKFYFGWNDSGTNAMGAAADKYVIVFFDVSSHANWQIKVGDGATEEVFTSAVAADTSAITHEIWVDTDGTVHWAINGTEQVIDGVGDIDSNKMDAAAHYLIVGQAQCVTGAAAITAEIDYVENEKYK